MNLGLKVTRMNLIMKLVFSCEKRISKILLKEGGEWGRTKSFLPVADFHGHGF